MCSTTWSSVASALSPSKSAALDSENNDQRRTVFDAVKKLYDSRSAAVHGSKIKGDTSTAVSESAELLCQLLRRSAERKSLPDENELVP